MNTPSTGTISPTANRYAPPRAAVRDVVDPSAGAELADRGLRLAAVLLDSIVFGVMIYLPLFIMAFAADTAGQTEGGGSETLVIVGGSLMLVGAVAWAWLTIRYVVANGQSIGKKMVGIKVVRTDGTPASLGRIFWLRNVVNGLVSIIPLYALIDALFIFGESRRCLHDKIADTIVVKA